MSFPDSSAPAATPPLWSVPSAVSATEAIHAAFPGLAASTPSRAVLLIPDGGLYLAFRLLPIFHRAGVAVDMMCPVDHPLTKSRYARHVCPVEDWPAAEARLAHFLRTPQRPWQRIMVAHEPSVRRLLAMLDAEALAAWQPGTIDSAMREFYLGKFGLPAAQARWGLPIPPSRVCATFEELCDFARSMDEAIITKPSSTLGGIGIRKFATMAEVLASGREMAFPLLAQKFIEGPRVVLEGFSSGGRLLAWLASYSIARARGPFTYSTGRQFCAMPALRPLVELIAARTRFEGFFGVDCIEETGTGRIYVVEFNPRATSGWRFGPDCGVDFAPAVAAWVGESPALKEPVTQPAGRAVDAHYFPSDLIRCLKYRDWRGLLNWLPGAKSRHDICWDDLSVLQTWVLQRLKNKKTAKAAARPAPVKR